MSLSGFLICDGWFHGFGSLIGKSQKPSPDLPKLRSSGVPVLGHKTAIERVRLGKRSQHP